MKQLDRDHYELMSGRRFYANNGLISLAEESDGTYTVGEGYDGHVDIDPSWTASEVRELADFMIARWTEFRENVKENGIVAQAGDTPSESRP